MLSIPSPSLVSSISSSFNAFQEGKKVPYLCLYFLIGSKFVFHASNTRLLAEIVLINKSFDSCLFMTALVYRYLTCSVARELNVDLIENGFNQQYLFEIGICV